MANFGIGTLAPRGFRAGRDNLDLAAACRAAERAVFGRISDRRAGRAAIGVEQDFVVGAFGGAVAGPAIDAKDAKAGWLAPGYRS